jgi:hypothetical protein
MATMSYRLLFAAGIHLLPRQSGAQIDYGRMPNYRPAITASTVTLKPANTFSKKGCPNYPDARQGCYRLVSGK